MRGLRSLYARLRDWVLGRSTDTELRAELASHIEEAIDDFRREGLSNAEARRAALKYFGGLAQTEEAYRDVRSFGWFEAARVDVRHAIRVLVRERTFTCFAVGTLALGIGAMTTVFSVVDAVLLQPLAYADPGRLYAVAEIAPKLIKEYPSLPVNGAHFRSWQQTCPSCEAGALLQTMPVNLTGAGEPERVDTILCTWQLFEVLGARAALGRTFSESEDTPGNNKYVVIADSLWRRRFNADPTVIGRTLQLNDTSHVIVGVLPADFRFFKGAQIGPLFTFPDRAEVFQPLGLKWAELRRVGSFNYAAVMRLRPDATRERAEAEMTAALAGPAEEMKTDLVARLTPLQEQVTGTSRAALWLLLGAVSALLLIVCVNLSNLMQVRATKRTREAAIRLALGARRAQLFRSMMTESLAIAILGGACGLLLGSLAIRALVAYGPADLPRLDEVRISLATLLFAFGTAMGCGVFCGVWPAVRVARAESGDALRATSRSVTEGRHALGLREWLVGAEVALSAVLLVVASLLGVSFVRLMNVNRGFDTARLLTADLSLPDKRYQTDEQRAEFHRRLIESLEAASGIQSAGLVSSLPLKSQVWGDAISEEGDTRPVFQRPLAHFRFASPHYFDAMDIAVRQGRGLMEADRPRLVAVVSESVAHLMWPTGSAIGKRIRGDDAPGTPWAEIIGVVADVRTQSLDQKPPLMVYVPYWDGKYWQGSVWGNATFVARTTQDPAGAAGAFRQAVRELDPQLPVANLWTMEQVTAQSVTGRRFQTQLAGSFAIAALLLACLGIYGVISYGVACRTNEMGLRMALGARPSEVARLVLRQGMTPVIIGLAAGIGAALTMGRLLSTLLFEIAPQDPATIVATTAALLTVSLAACWIPARRASRIDPALALRHE